MNKKEKETILSQYERILYVNEITTNGDKFDSTREFAILLKNLGLENEKIEVENNIYFKKHNLNYIQIEGYKSLIKIISKYINRNINVTDIEEMLDNIEFEITETDKKGIQKCYNLINWK